MTHQKTVNSICSTAFVEITSKMFQNVQSINKEMFVQTTGDLLKISSYGSVSVLFDVMLMTIRNKT